MTKYWRCSVCVGPALSASLEDYLEAIFHIVEAKGAAKPRDIVHELKIGASSVTAALKSLAAKDLVNYSPYDIVTLTKAGADGGARCRAPSRNTA